MVHRVNDPQRPPGGVPRWIAQLGFALSAFAVFACGWLGMRTDDRGLMVLYAVLALGAAALASAFSRRR